MQEFTDAYSKYLEAVMQTSKQLRGVIDYFNGDRVCVTFNAILPAVQHVRKATVWATLLGPGVDGTVVTGIACGTSVCGNVGCTGMKKFIIFGRAVTEAHTLVRMAAILNERIVMEGVAAEQAGFFYYMKILCKLLLPNREKAALLRAVVSPIAVPEAGEWMYTIEAAKTKDPYTNYNAAVRQMYDGDYDEASASLQASATEAGELAALKQRIAACREADQPEPPMLL